MKKRLTAMLIVLAMLMTVFPAVSAENSVPADEGFDNDEFTVEVLPNEEVEASLPEYLQDALNDTITTYGAFKPSSSSVYDLSTGRWDFYVYSKMNSTIYSRYVFVGHDGAVRIRMYDFSTDSGNYTLKVFKKGLFDTTVYSKVCEHDSLTDVTVDVGDPDAKIYIAVIANGITDIQDAFIEKG